LNDTSLPALWLVDNADLLPDGGRALDVACGHGRNALWLGERGFVTTAVDRDVQAVDVVNDEARRRGIPVRAEAADLEAGDVSLGIELYDVIVVVHYLHRPLFPALLRALRPGAVLVYETFTRAQASRGKPTNPAFLLESGELRTLMRPLQILREREGDFDGRMVAGVIARA
jgi:2-polyprenyl-3-methyl-5-hydroxy-6-metoxy-1,4-benzoquinol methylase